MTTTIDPNELKPAKEWLNYLPEPLRTKALEACERWPNQPNKQCQFSDCLISFLRHQAGIGLKWNKVHTQLQTGEILPVEPEQSKQQEPKPMSETEGTKNKKVDMVELSEFVKKLVETIGEQQGKLEALQKELDTRCPKQIEDKQPEPQPKIEPKPKSKIDDLKDYLNDLDNLIDTGWFPQDSVKECTFYHKDLTLRDFVQKGRNFIGLLLTEPSEVIKQPAPVKLPVTVEEVWELEKAFKGRKCWFVSGNVMGETIFNGSPLVDEYRHESSAKFVDAVRKLTKIQEAQNEMCPGDGMIYFAAYSKEKGEILVKQAGPLVDHEYGLIIFHSEQGLKDCIAANEQLWKDYLGIS